ncbi:amino acid ABC transporter substrate-binding protein [Rhizobium sp. FY34]|uniref:amino acid ABC transporter substrate-binding protein n=1 Tax=Rhizobium sp. FY34 TaxID=2562309 RepID=UPI001981420F|nr:amino acid ABC transporter substrate-binding protein [Rhizobium sp. FY34]
MVRAFLDTLAVLVLKMTATLAIVAAVAGQVFAQAPVSTLDRIKETGSLKVGYGSAPPFSFLDEDGQVAGYAIDLCKALAEEIRNALAMTEIRIDYVLRTPANRVQLLNSGDIDIECNASTNTAERRKAAAFAPPHFIAQTRFVSLRQNNIRTIEDLRGKTVSVVLGTVNVGQILHLSREMRLGLASIPVADVQSAFDLVKVGSVSAFAMDDILLTTMIASTGKAEDYLISNETLGEPAPYGFMTRLDDAPFTALVAESLERIYKSPQMKSIYDKWFMQPIRGGRYTLNVPMSAQLKSAMGIAD